MLKKIKDKLWVLRGKQNTVWDLTFKPAREMLVEMGFDYYGIGRWPLNPITL